MNRLKIFLFVYSISFSLYTNQIIHYACMYTMKERGKQKRTGVGDLYLYDYKCIARIYMYIYLALYKYKHICVCIKRERARQKRTR